MLGSGDVQAAGLSIVSREGGTSSVPGPRLRIIRRIPERDLWRRDNFGVTANSGDAADLADPDGDGLANLLEYALAADPLAPSADALPAVTYHEGRLRFDVPVPRADVIYTVEASSDLVSWTPLASRSGSTASGEVWSVTDDSSALEAPRRFLRLRVSLP